MLNSPEAKQIPSSQSHSDIPKAEHPTLQLSDVVWLFDDGHLRIGGLNGTAIVVKYNLTEVTGIQQIMICHYIKSHFGFAANVVIVRACSYAMSQDAITYLREFVRSFTGKMAYVFAGQNSSNLEVLANALYLRGKLIGNFNDFDGAYQALRS